MDRLEESPPLRLCGVVGTLATCGRRGHRILHDPRHGTERVDETDSQPDAGHAAPTAYDLWLSPPSSEQNL